MARRKVLRRAGTGLCSPPRSPRRSRCHSSSTDLCERIDRLDRPLLMLLSSSTMACSKSRATEPLCTIGGRSSRSILGRWLPSALSSSLSVLLSGLSALAMLASVPRRLPWYGSWILGRLSNWLRWSSRSGSGVLYLVCDLSDRGVYDIVAVVFYYSICMCVLRGLRLVFFSIAGSERTSLSLSARSPNACKLTHRQQGSCSRLPNV